MNRVPCIRFDTADLPERERFAHWSAALPVYDLFEAKAAKPGQFHVRSDAWMLGDMLVSATRLSPVRFERSVRKLTADGGDHLSLLLPRQGGWVGDAAGRELTIGPGQIGVFDLSCPFHIEGAGSDTATLTIARAAMTPALALGVNLHGVMFQGPVARVLADHMMLLVRQLHVMDESEGPTVVRATVGLIAACIAASPELFVSAASPRGEKIRHRVGRYIDQHLDMRDLAPKKICQEVGVSRSNLYRAFAPLGGVADYIRARRLETVHVLLENPTVDRSISAIASDFGFISDAHFSRTFRRRFGYSPRRARNGQLAALHDLAAVVDAHAVPEVFSAWLNKIG
jgi:AraC-like DNA-binding protein